MQNLTKVFRSSKKYAGFGGALKSLFTREYESVKAVDGISFDIERSQVVGYIGPNGAGKSTTIKMMTGILTPDSGQIEVDGIVPYRNRSRNAFNIGVVFGQRTQLWWDLPLSESFSLLRDIYDVPKREYEKRMEYLESVLGFREFILSPVRSLSLGQRMRADLAASLLHNPKVLFLDEPTIGLDALVKEKVREAIKSINAEYGTTIVLTTHDLNDIEELCDRIIVIDKGRKVYDGSLKDVKERYGYTRTIRLRVPGALPSLAAELGGTLSPIDPELGCSLDGEELCVGFNRTLVSVADIVQRVMKRTEVADFSISETRIEDIIKRIYSDAAAGRGTQA